MAAAHLAATLSRLLHKAGRQSGALVYDLTAHRPVYALRAGLGRPPASVEKLYTTLAAVRMLGPGARLRTISVPFWDQRRPSVMPGSALTV